MIAVVLFIYSIYEMLKFLFFATLGDIVTTIKGNYGSKEYYRFCYCLLPAGLEEQQYQCT